MEPNAQSPATVEVPRGFFPVRVDDKGRLKLPVPILRYLRKLGETDVFVTTVDKRIARIYPISVWRQNEMLQGMPGEDPQAIEDLVWLANRYGADSEIDAQGRVLLHTELRRLLGLENEQVFLQVCNGRIDVQSNAMVDEREAKASSDLDAKLRSAAKMGFH